MDSVKNKILISYVLFHSVAIILLYHLIQADINKMLIANILGGVNVYLMFYSVHKLALNLKDSSRAKGPLFALIGLKVAILSLTVFFLCQLSINYLFYFCLTFFAHLAFNTYLVKKKLFVY